MDLNTEEVKTIAGTGKQGTDLEGGLRGPKQVNVFRCFFFLNYLHLQVYYITFTYTHANMNIYFLHLFH